MENLEKLSRLATQKRFNFFVRPLFTHYYNIKANLNYDKIAHLCKTNDVDIAICMEPPVRSAINGEDFKKKISAAMDAVSMPYEILPQGDIKDSDALNLMLDIAICAKKK